MRKANYGLTGAGAVVVGAIVGSLGCADPCVDDGLNQKGCPEDETDSAEATDTNDEGTGEQGTADDEETGGGTGGGEMCPDLNVVLTPEVATIQLVVDKSGSMGDDFSGPTKWEAIRDTLIDPMDGVVTDLQSEIRFGLSLYSGPMGMCPDVIEMAPQLDAADEIETILAANMPGGDTPTGESLEIAIDSLKQDTWDGNHYLVLATDGEPDVCAIPDPMTMDEIDMVRGRAVDALQGAYADGIPSFIISVGDAVAEEHLQDLANAGAGVGMGDPDATFYQALDSQTLIDAFNDIISGLRECTLTLDKPLKPELADSCDLTINDNSIPYDDPDGWTLDGDDKIELQGTSCTSIQEGVVVIEMACTCELG